jgi:eukaryotic-like serine/threonine-protein kinase
MATVYAATHRNGNRAALKVLHEQLSREEDTRARFLREGYVANAVGHPGVVHVLDDDVSESGAVFLVLELLEGESIETRRLRFGGALPIDEALEIADQALDALGAAHEKGIVHRDVKPDNVFLTKDKKVKLLDFGLARMKDAQAETTKTGVTMGTLEFMPPEQALGRRDDIDARTDVWAVGATLFTALTGEYVHEASTLHEKLTASATQRARPIRTLAPHVPPGVAYVIDRALQMEMADRWPSAREMQKALREARGAASKEFTADSVTIPITSFRPSEPTSSEKTRPMLSSAERHRGDDEPTVQLPGNGPLPWSAAPATPRMMQPSREAVGATAPSPGVGDEPPVSSQRGTSARTVVIVSILLILICAAVGIAVLLRPGP